MNAKRNVVAMTLICVATAGQAQMAGRAVSGAAQAMADIAMRQIESDLAIERERVRISMELAAAKELDRSRQEPQRIAKIQAGIDPEVALLEKLHPQWARILNSASFEGWLKAQPPSYASTCKTTHSGRTMAACIDDFFGPPLAAK